MSQPPHPLRFDARWNRQRRRRSSWRRWRWTVPFALVAVLAGLALLAPAREAGEWSPMTFAYDPCESGSNPCVVDGDTVKWGTSRIRLTGFDTPELDGACPQEREKAIEARTALVEWLGKGPFEWDGGPDPPRDRYGRELRAVRRGDEYLADRMIEAGLASGSDWGASEIDWCAPR